MYEKFYNMDRTSKVLIIIIVFGSIGIVAILGSLIASKLGY